jgi:hypothetical protein
LADSGNSATLACTIGTYQINRLTGSTGIGGQCRQALSVGHTCQAPVRCDTRRYLTGRTGAYAAMKCSTSGIALAIDLEKGLIGAALICGYRG